MPATLVDSNVILDVLTEDPDWLDWSASALARQADAGSLVVNPVIYAEVAARFERIEDLEEALPVEYYRRDPLPWEAAFLAGRCFVRYPAGRRAAALAPPRLLHRRPRAGLWADAVDARRPALPHVLPEPARHRALNRHGRPRRPHWADVGPRQPTSAEDGRRPVQGHLGLHHSANISCSPSSTAATVAGVSRPRRLTRRSRSTVRS